MSRLISIVLLFGWCITSRAAQQLNIFIWSEYLSAEVVAAFEQRFDCKVVVDNYESSEGMLAKIQAGGADLYDLVVPSDEALGVLAGQGMLAPLDQSKIPNLKNLEARFRNLPYDPGNKFSVAFQWGTFGIYARKNPDAPLEESWAIFFDPKKQPGPLMLIDSPTDLIRAALLYKGHDFNSTNPQHLKEVRDLLIATKKRALGFSNTVGGRASVLNKSARAAMIYSGEAARGMQDDSETYYFIPREGSLIWVDNMVIPKKAPHRELAHKFINYILEPEVGAKISNTYHYATPNREAKKFIKPELLTNTVIYPADETFQRLEYARHLGRDSRLHDQLWTSIKSN
jgi:spermidine/putrescine transport system substrate-binding protein